MSKLLAMAVPITKGKEADFKKFIAELNGKYYNDFLESRERYKIHERTFHQVTPMGEFVVVTLEGDDPEYAFRDFSNGNDEFTKWFLQKVKEIHNFDLTQSSQIEMPKLVVDSKKQQTETKSTAKLIAFAVPIIQGKENEWHKFIDDTNGRYYKDFKASRDRLNVHERTFDQVTPMGEITVVTIEGDNPEQALMDFGKGNDDFTRWFTQKVKEIHNYDLNAPPPFSLPELIVDSKKKQVTA